MKKFLVAACAALALLMSVVQAQAMPVYTATVSVVDGSAEATNGMNHSNTIVESSVTARGDGSYLYSIAGSTAFGANENLRVMSISSVPQLTVTKFFMQLDTSVLEEHITQSSAPFEVNVHNLGPFTMYGILFDVNFTSGFDISFVSGAPGQGNMFMGGVDGDGNEAYAYNADLADQMTPFSDPADFGRIFTVHEAPPERTEIPEPATLALAVPFLFWLVGKAMIRQRKPAVAKV